MAAIVVQKLTRDYNNHKAVDGVSFEVGSGEIFGYLGPNGAGKTTTMRIIATLLEPSWGEAYVCNHSIYSEPKEIRRLVGYMPDFFGVYDDMKVIEYLEFFAAAYKIPRPRRKRVIDDVLALTDLGPKRDDLVMLAELVRTGALRTIVGRTYELDDAGAAIAMPVVTRVSHATREVGSSPMRASIWRSAPGAPRASRQRPRISKLVG